MNEYPDESILRKIKRWDGKNVDKILTLILGEWNNNYGRFEITGKKVRTIKFITGGWSGNEDILRNIPPIFDMLYWQSSHRGGLHIYKVYEVKP
jgi:hypothetical protein